MCTVQSILSIQSHVAYGYVGNKAAVYPLQYMGYDVWPVNTVQFSSHTEYGTWRGEIFTAEHIKSVVQGIVDIGQAHKCSAILSGYMGSQATCQVVSAIVRQFKAMMPGIVYLCDPVMGDAGECYVKPEVVDFFCTHLVADIITPNQYEAEILTGIKITDIASLKQVAAYFYARGIKIVIITGIKFSKNDNILYIFVGNAQAQYLSTTREYHFPLTVHGTGDLFSGLYLGHYLRTDDIGLALQYTLYHMLEVLKYTHERRERELQVLSVRYDIKDNIQLPQLVVL